MQKNDGTVTVVAVPLSSNWTFWFKERTRDWGENHTAADEWRLRLRQRRRTDWGANVRPLFEVSTAGEFLGAYNAAKLPSALPPGSGYYFFKRGIRPVWEDPSNRGGGSWKILLDDRPDGNGNELNLVWSELLYMLVTDGFRELSAYVCGVACAVRRGDGTHKVAVWTVRGGGGDEHVVNVGRLLRLVIRDVYRGVKSITYETHRADNKCDGVRPPPPPAAAHRA